MDLDSRSTFIPSPAHPIANDVVLAYIHQRRLTIITEMMELRQELREIDKLLALRLPRNPSLTP